MLKYALVLGALALVPMTAHAADYSTETVTAAQLVVPSVDSGLQRAFYKVCVKPNSPVGAWFSRRDHSPGPNGVGSFYRAPGQCEEFQRPVFIPPGELWAAGDSGTAKISAEVY